MAGNISSSSIEKKGSDAEITMLESVSSAGLSPFHAAKEAHEKSIDAQGLTRLIPMPTPDPKDPLNLPTWRKMIAIFSLCLFGALAAAAELILGAMLPVFVFEYAGIDPKQLNEVKLGSDVDALTILAMLPGPPIWKTYLLASLPILMMGIANFFLVPLAISVGRRAILLSCGVAALCGCIWAGFSQSLDSHLAARCIQALGAGTVESLIPFIIQDMVFFHQRNTAISVVFAIQGLIIVGLGGVAPYVIIYLTWRWMYFITAAGGAVCWVLMFLLLPETRYYRPEWEQNGVPATPLPEGLERPEIDFINYNARSWKADLQTYGGKADWNAGIQALWDTVRTFFYPHIFFITMLNSFMIATLLAAGYTVSPQLLTSPYSWPFLHLGLCLIPVIIAAIASYLISGYGADKVANWLAKRRGRRDPEFQALNLIIPTCTGLAGCIVFGYAGDNPTKFPWEVYLLGMAMIAFGFLSTNTIGIVYVLEAYPHLAGPALVNIASFRCILAFALSFRVSEWVANLGYLKTFSIYGGVLGGFIVFIPIVFIFGEGWRKRWPALPKDHVTLSTA